jgi:hypothetical protein
MICIIDACKDSMAKVLEFITREEKLHLHVQHYSAALVKEDVISIGRSLYNKVPDKIKLS